MKKAAKKIRIVSLLAALTALALTACPSGTGGPPPSSPSAKEITAFSFASPAAAGTIDQANRTVTVTVPSGTNMKSLAPSIIHSGAFISPASGVPQDFYKAGFTPVVYTVTAGDGSTALWTVTVRMEPLPPAASIAGYINGEANYAGTDADPIPLPLGIDLSTEWANLLSAINTAGKYVALDLSACTMAGAEFDPQPGASNSGESWIISLALPDAAAGIKAAGAWNDRPFRYFSSLKSLNAGKVTNVGGYAFSGCTSLTAISLPQAANVGGYAFSGCASLTEINLPKVASIGYEAFSSCTSLTAISLPQAANIGDYAFGGCTSLTEISLPSVASIDVGAFVGCTSLASVSLPASLTDIGANPFPGCTALANITVAAANPAYKAEGGKLLSKDGKTLIGWPTASGAVTLNEITSVGAYAFFACTSLTAISLPAATNIGDYAFGLCTSLSTISLPQAASIGDYAFYRCSSLATVNLPAIESIGRAAFNDTGTTALALTLGPTVPILGDQMFWGVSSKAVTVQVPSGSSGYGSAPA
ncbi:MAG: leucine-rich repeat protein, partial [Treponema sp.]|nr:leucine-rich repeat protein [Treponema sp.]